MIIWGGLSGAAKLNSGGRYNAVAALGEVSGLTLSADGVTLAWNAPEGVGASTVYDVVRGSTAELPVGGGASESCLASGLAALTTVDPATPAVGSARWYLVRGADPCSQGSYGLATGGPERSTTTCP